MQEIEILPKDKYLHYITLPKNHDIISWSFSTHKKSILFGLFIQSTVNTSSHNVNEINEFSSNDSNNPMNGLGLTVNGTIRSMSSRKRRGSVNSQWNKQDISGLEVPGEEINKNNSKLSIDISHTSDFETGSKKSINLTNGHRKNKFNKGGELIEVLPLKSYDSNKTTIKGEHKVNQPGTYILYFDNSNSWNTTKKLTFHVTTFKEKKVKIESPSISGWILKKKRKKMQGWAKRWCIIKEGMLSYAKDDKSIVRGSLNIAHSVATFDYDTLMLFIDSGSNFFRFKFLDLEAFKAWEKIIVYYLELEDIPPKSPILNLEEIVESDSEQNHIVNSISRSLSIKQSILNNNHNTLDPTLSESRCPELKGMIENLFIDFDFLSNQITKTLNENDLNLPDLKLDVEKNGTGKENKLQFFSFRSKKENPNKSINSPQKTNSLISTTIENLKSKQEELEAFKLKAYQILEEEINQRHKSQLNYLNLVSELSQLKSSRPSSPLPSPSDPSVTFQNMMAPTRNSQHNRRRSVYSRRQSSIMTMSSAGNNDEFFDALEGDESPDLEEPVVVINESEDDDSGAEEEEVENESSHTENEENEEKFNEIESSNLLQEELIEADNFEPKGESPNKQENKLINRRSQLPSPVCGEEISFLGILRKNVGKDLSTVTLPVSLNEPLNILQRLCEELEYFELLNKANTTDDSLERLIYITAFAISPYAASGQRSARKPFNPLLGETFEYIREDYGFKFISEKVSHNPPIFACYSESENYEFWQESSPKSKFWGKSMELNSGGTSHIRLKKYNEHYTYNKAVGWMRNLVGGNKYLEYSGEVIVKNQTSKEYSKVSFKESTFFVSSNNEIKATIFNNKGKSMYQLEGQWSHSILWNKGNDHLEVIFRPNPPIANSAKMYNFTKFAVELNELTPDIKDKLPITDTRYRPDQRYFEEGKVELAEQEKSRVEELQRARRRHREQNNITYTPVWFELKPTIDYEGKKCESWQYKGGYFEARESKSFNNLPNLWN